MYFILHFGIQILDVAETCGLFLSALAYSGPLRLSPGNRSRAYTRDQLLNIRPRAAVLDSDLRSHLSSLQIGLHLSTRRGKRGGTRKQRKIETVGGFGRPKLTASPPFSTVPPCKTNSAPPLCRTAQGGGIRKQRNLISVPRAPHPVTATNISLAVFNAQSLGPTCKKKRSAVNDFIVSNNIDIFCATETWFKEKGDEPKLQDLAPAYYTPFSFPRPTTTCGGGIAFVVSDRLLPYCTFNSSFVFHHTTFELVHLKLSLPCSPVTNIFGMYRPVPSQKNKLTPNMFINELPDFLEFVHDLPGTLLLVGDFNFHFNKPTVG